MTLEPGEYKITNGDDVVDTMSGHPDGLEDIPRIYTKTDVDGFFWQVIPGGGHVRERRAYLESGSDGGWW